MISKVIYTGRLRTENQHLKSGATYNTDAPVDNNGLGQAFSPTDTVATALANCMFTIMGIKAKGLEVILDGSEAIVSKQMDTNPRRISKIEIVFSLPKTVVERHQKILEKAANSCPVLHSLHPDITKEIVFNWNQ